MQLGDDAAWETLFTPALTHYDIVLKLRRASLPFPEHALFTPKQIKRRLVKELGVDADGLLEAERGNKRGLQLAKMPEKVLSRGPDKRARRCSSALILFGASSGKLRGDSEARRFCSLTSMEAISSAWP